MRDLDPPGRRLGAQPGGDEVRAPPDQIERQVRRQAEGVELGLGWRDDPEPSVRTRAGQGGDLVAAGEDLPVDGVDGRPGRRGRTPPAD